MKNRSFIRPGGILSWSTACLLAGGAVSLSSCEKSVSRVMDEGQRSERTTETDAVQKQLESGLVPNNFHLPKVGYYHAGVNRFYDTPYNQYRDQQWFVNGEWVNGAGPDNIPATRPDAESLKKVDTALSEEQRTAGTQASGGGFSMMNAMMMYWLLAGNRGLFSPGSGFQWAQRQAPAWQANRQVRPNNPATQTQNRQQGVSSRGGFGSSQGFSSSSS
ncbi:MAG: hypothetical protein QM627_07130 [Luteolibacter sp.]